MRVISICSNSDGKQCKLTRSHVRFLKAVLSGRFTSTYLVPLHYLLPFICQCNKSIFLSPHYESMCHDIKKWISRKQKSPFFGAQDPRSTIKLNPTANASILRAKIILIRKHCHCLILSSTGLMW